MTDLCTICSRTNDSLRAFSVRNRYERGFVIEAVNETVRREGDENSMTGITAREVHPPQGASAPTLPHNTTPIFSDGIFRVLEVLCTLPTVIPWLLAPSSSATTLSLIAS